MNDITVYAGVSAGGLKARVRRNSAPAAPVNSMKHLDSGVNDQCCRPAKQLGRRGQRLIIAVRLNLSNRLEQTCLELSSKFQPIQLNSALFHYEVSA